MFSTPLFHFQGYSSQCSYCIITGTTLEIFHMCSSCCLSYFLVGLLPNCHNISYKTCGDLRKLDKFSNDLTQDLQDQKGCQGECDYQEAILKELKQGGKAEVGQVTQELD